MKVIILIFIISLLASCGISKQEVSIENSIQSESSTSQQPNATESNEVQGSTDIRHKEIEITTVNFSNQNVIIRYPEIINQNDENKLEKINEVLKNSVLQALEYYQGTEQSYVLDMYYVSKWKSNIFLSIQYLGASYVSEGAYPTNIFSTMNLDVKNGKKIVLMNMVKIDEKFVYLLRNGEYVPYDPMLKVEPEIKDALSNYTDTELLSYLYESDEVSDKNELGIFTYFTKDSLGLSFQVPHALGDHAEFEIKYSDLEDHILRQNTVWNDILPTFH